MGIDYDFGNAQLSFKEFLKAMSLPLPNIPEWTLPVVHTGTLPWPSKTPVVPEEDEMTEEELFLVVAERLMGNYVKIRYPKTSKHVRCYCQEGRVVKIDMGNIYDDNKPLRGHVGICPHCRTLFVRMWDKGAEPND